MSNGILTNLINVDVDVTSTSKIGVFLYNYLLGLNIGYKYICSFFSFLSGLIWNYRGSSNAPGCFMLQKWVKDWLCGQSGT